MEGQRDVTLLALKMEEGDHEPKKVGGPITGKEKETDSLLKSPERNTTRRTP